MASAIGSVGDLAGKLEKYGAAHFDPKGTRPLHYFQLLVLVALTIAITPVLGGYMARVFTGRRVLARLNGVDRRVLRTQRIARVGSNELMTARTGCGPRATGPAPEEQGSGWACHTRPPRSSCATCSSCNA